MVTKEQLKAIFYPVSSLLIDEYYGYLCRYMEEYHINTPLRISAFLAQIGHESGRLKYSEEIASGEAYEERIDLGNVMQGDGKRFKGRGLIQLTGRTNYELISKDLGIDAVNNPKLLALPEYAVLCSVWFWNRKKLNLLADQKKFREITIRINGGLNGFEDRIKMYELAKMALGL